MDMARNTVYKEKNWVLDQTFQSWLNKSVEHWVFLLTQRVKDGNIDEKPFASSSKTFDFFLQWNKILEIVLMADSRMKIVYHTGGNITHHTCPRAAWVDFTVCLLTSHCTVLKSSLAHIEWKCLCFIAFNLCHRSHHARRWSSSTTHTHLICDFYARSKLSSS